MSLWSGCYASTNIWEHSPLSLLIKLLATVKDGPELDSHLDQLQALYYQVAHRIVTLNHLLRVRLSLE